MLTELPIWKETDPYGKLDWYRKVADNELPAKYLITKRIAIPDNFLEMDTDKLWKLHEDTTHRFMQLFNSVKSKELELTTVPKTSPSLLDLNVELVNRMLRNCDFCQWECNVNREDADLSDDKKTGACQLGEESRVGSFFHHRGEELIYRGNRGSGTIFFTSCNMRCQFCQNGNISKDKFNGQVTTPEELAAMMWLLRMEGCHNINFVGGDPTIHLHTILRSFPYLRVEGPPIEIINRIRRAKSDSFIQFSVNDKNGVYNGEFNAPMLWNSNFFMSEKTMKILRTMIDIWLPDFKFGPEKKCATRLSRTPWYWDTITRNHQMIYDWDENFTIRHLVMPNHVDCCTKPILSWIAEYMPDIPVNIMDQYHPDSFANPSSPKYNDRMEDISRRLRRSEFQDAINFAKELNLIFNRVSFD